MTNDEATKLREKVMADLNRIVPDRATEGALVDGPYQKRGKVRLSPMVAPESVVVDIADPSYITEEDSPQAQAIILAEPQVSSVFSLRPYQAEAVSRIIAMQGRAILAYDMGTGKTAVALKVLEHISLGASLQDTLVICPKIAFGTWEMEIDNWLKDKYYVTFTGDEGKRYQRWRDFQAGADFLITNFAQMENVLVRKKKWGTVIIDEAHFLKNRKTKGFDLACKLVSDNVLLLTGSPIVNGVQDLWTLLHLLHPRDFRSYWNFVNANCIVLTDHWGAKIVGVRDPAVTRKVLAPHLLRKTKKQVLHDLPPKIRQAIPLEIEGVQYDLYQQIAKEMIAELGEDEFLLTPNKIAQITRLRQILVTPALVGGPHESAMFEALKESVKLDFEAGNSVIVFTPFAKALPLLEADLASMCDYITSIRGGMKEGEVPRRIKEFQEYPSAKCALLCSLLVGSSFTATKASVVYFMGYDWVPANCYQGEDRTHRIGQKKSVNVKYFVCKGTIDTYIMAVLNKKASWSKIILDKGYQGLLLPDNKASEKE